jgi:hypothetical protein
VGDQAAEVEGREQQVEQEVGVAVGGELAALDGSYEHALDERTATLEVAFGGGGELGMRLHAAHEAWDDCSER